MHHFVQCQNPKGLKDVNQFKVNCFDPFFLIFFILSDFAEMYNFCVCLFFVSNVKTEMLLRTKWDDDLPTITASDKVHRGLRKLLASIRISKVFKNHHWENENSGKNSNTLKLTPDDINSISQTYSFVIVFPLLILCKKKNCSHIVVFFLHKMYFFVHICNKCKCITVK